MLWTINLRKMKIPSNISWSNGQMIMQKLGIQMQPCISHIRLHNPGESHFPNSSTHRPQQEKEWRALWIWMMEENEPYKSSVFTFTGQQQKSYGSAAFLAFVSRRKTAISRNRLPCLSFTESLVVCRSWKHFARRGHSIKFQCSWIVRWHFTSVVGPFFQVFLNIPSKYCWKFFLIGLKRLFLQ